MRADPTAELTEIYVRVAPEDIAYLKFVIESYETVGFLRTIDPKAATLAVYLVPDFAAVGDAILRSVAREIPLERIPKPADLGDDWLVAAVRGVA
ncbi:MAG: DUF4911 domain-containing protein [Candidatus Binatia bacterium]